MWSRFSSFKQASKQGAGKKVIGIDSKTWGKHLQQFSTVRARSIFSFFLLRRYKLFTHSCNRKPKQLASRRASCSSKSESACAKSSSVQSRLLFSQMISCASRTTLTKLSLVEANLDTRPKPWPSPLWQPLAKPLILWAAVGLCGR